MTNKNEQLLVNSEAYVSYIKRRKIFILKLVLFHFALVLLFDALAVFYPMFFSRPAWQGSAFTIGIIYAFFIIFSVVISTFYYSHRINQEEASFRKSPGQSDRIAS